MVFGVPDVFSAYPAYGEVALEAREPNRRTHRPSLTNNYMHHLRETSFIQDLDTQPAIHNQPFIIHTTIHPHPMQATTSQNAKHHPCQSS